MASVIDDKNKNTAAAQVEQPKKAAEPFAGVPGVTEETGRQVNRLAQGYAPSEQVDAAKGYLDDVIAGKPGDHNDTYRQQLEDVFDLITDRPDFSYDPAGDPLYRHYSRKYQDMGRQAMMDTSARAAALTGGYGNSYAATAGSQAYGDYLEQLNDILPQLYQQARDNYDAQGQALTDRRDMLMRMDETEYARYRDSVADWQDARDAAADEYWKVHDADYQDYVRQLDYWSDIARMENSQYNADRDLAWDKALSVIRAGNVPTKALRQAAGISYTNARRASQ